MAPSKAAADAMTSDLDIYRTASLLIEQHGDQATIHDAMRADELLEAGDIDGRVAADHQGRRGHTAGLAGAGRAPYLSCGVFPT